MVRLRVVSKTVGRLRSPLAQPFDQHVGLIENKMVASLTGRSIRSFGCRTPKAFLSRGIRLPVKDDLVTRFIIISGLPLSPSVAGVDKISTLIWVQTHSLKKFKQLVT